MKLYDCSSMSSSTTAIIPAPSSAHHHHQQNRPHSFNHQFSNSHHHNNIHHDSRSTANTMLVKKGVAMSLSSSSASTVNGIPQDLKQKMSVLTVAQNGRTSKTSDKIDACGHVNMINSNYDTTSTNGSCCNGLSISYKQRGEDEYRCNGGGALLDKTLITAGSVCCGFDHVVDHHSHDQHNANHHNARHCSGATVITSVADKLSESLKSSLIVLNGGAANVGLNPSSNMQHLTKVNGSGTVQHHQHHHRHGTNGFTSGSGDKNYHDEGQQHGGQCGHHHCYRHDRPPHHVHHHNHVDVDQSDMHLHCHRHDHSSGGSSRSGSSTDITDVLDDSCLSSSAGSSALSSPCTPPPPLPLAVQSSVSLSPVSTLSSVPHKSVAPLLPAPPPPTTSNIIKGGQTSATTRASTSSLASSCCSSASTSDRSLLSCCSCSCSSSSTTTFSDYTPSSPSSSSESSTPPPPPLVDSLVDRPPSRHNKHQSGSSHSGTVDAYVGLKPTTSRGSLIGGLEASPPPPTRRMTFAETLRYTLTPVHPPPHPPPVVLQQQQTSSHTTQANDHRLLIVNGSGGGSNANGVVLNGGGGGHDYGSMFVHVDDDHDVVDADQLITDQHHVNSRSVLLNGSKSSSMASSCSLSCSPSTSCCSLSSSSDAKDHHHNGQLDDEQEQEDAQPQVDDIEIPRFASGGSVNGVEPSLCFGSPSAFTPQQAKQSDIVHSPSYYSPLNSTYYHQPQNLQPNHALYGAERCKKWLDGALTDLILKTYTHRRQPKDLLDYKCQLQDIITQQLSGHLLDPIDKNKPVQFKIYLVGSSLTSIGSMRSDIDLCMVIYDRDTGKVDERYNLRFWAELLLEKISEILERGNVAQKAKVIRANVPILKFFDNAGGHIEVNLNLNKLVTVQNTMLLVHLCSLDARVAPFLFTVKLWAQKNGINCAFFKSLSSYSLSLMAIFFLQNVCKPAILPPFSQLVDYVVKSTSLFHFQQDFNGSREAPFGDTPKQMHVTSSMPPLYSIPPPPPPPPFALLNCSSPDGTFDPSKMMKYVFTNAISKVTFLDSNSTSQPPPQLPLPLLFSCPTHQLQPSGKWSATITNTTSKKPTKKQAAQAAQQQEMERCYYWFYYYYYYNSMLNNNGPASDVASRLLTGGSSVGASTTNGTITASSSSCSSNSCHNSSESDRSSISSINSTTSLPSPSWQCGGINGSNSNTKGVATSKPWWNNDSWTLSKCNNNCISGGDHNSVARTTSGVVSHDIDGHCPVAASLRPPPPPSNDNCRHLNCLNDDLVAGDGVVGLEGASGGATVQKDTDLDCEGASTVLLSTSTNKRPAKPSLLLPSSSTNGLIAGGGTNRWIDHHVDGSLMAQASRDHRQYHHADLCATCDNARTTNNTTCCDKDHQHTCSNHRTTSSPPSLINGQFNATNDNQQGMIIPPHCNRTEARQFSPMMQQQLNGDRNELHSNNYESSVASPLSRKSSNTQSLGSLFADFITYYSNASIFDSVISIRTGQLMKRTDPVFARSSETSMETFICIEEPFNHTNTSHSVHNDFMFNFICKSFRWTRDSINKMKLTVHDFV